MNPDDPTLRETRLARLGWLLVAVGAALEVLRTVLNDTSINSLLGLAVISTIAGVTALLRAGRHL